MNNKEQLPLSPHLQVYRPQLTSVLSIKHRITGFCLSLALPLYIFWLISLLFGPLSYTFFLKICSHYILKIIFILITYGFIYHMMNGIRHLFWDLGIGLSIKFSSISAVFIIILSVLLTFFVTSKFIL
ncbi:MAG: succinate dehydrogenase, cytochrome b556 subunit [Rickettsiales bacterium]|nr:succinate dehydrogenase, cytochrome b556 subunit [Rickettsiales bacterium]OUV54574.1 MAG: succinate dehydrogenase, cytochrome b556 subunit [Rickettsiales bacterium TMED127]|tara:strand:+ start:7160 stop:7543 length:384 start_codon:yes stop_codon:yes gene_type:complete